MTLMPSATLLDRIRSASESGSFEGSGLLFHGTLEDFQGRPEVRGVDGLLWFADTPLIAQTYIPICGLSSIVAMPSPYRLGERLRPDKHSFWTEFAVGTLGRAMPEGDYDQFGQARSWTVTPDWPTYGDCVGELRKLGYSFDNGTAYIRHGSATSSETRTVERADWQQVGRVYITTADGLQLRDDATGEGDLTDPSHLRLDSFRDAENQGFSGIVIDDFAQSHDHGNVGHRGIGLFPRGVASRDFAVYPAIHRLIGDWGRLTTDDFESFVAGLDQDPELAAPAMSLA